MARRRGNDPEKKKRKEEEERRERERRLADQLAGRPFEAQSTFLQPLDFEAEARARVEEGRRAGRPRMQPRQQRPVSRGVLRPEDFRNYSQDRALVEELAGFGVPPEPPVQPMFEPPFLLPPLPPPLPGPTRA